MNSGAQVVLDVWECVEVAFLLNRSISFKQLP